MRRIRVRDWRRKQRVGNLVLVIDVVVMFGAIGFLLGVLWMRSMELVVLWKYLPVDKFGFSLWVLWFLTPESWRI